MMGADNLRADPIRSPWDARGLPADAVEIRMVAPRSAMPPAGRYMLLALGIAGALLSLRFLMLGAWPVLLFSVLDIGALAIALHMFDRSAVPEERLRVRDNEIELVRSDHRRREKRIVLPAFWTRLEISGRSGVDHNLWLVFRQQRHPIGLCVSAEERRNLEPQIRAALASARG